ncbi:MAG: ATP-binding protein [Bacteroidales bacterium]|nr:ATP-binding protein [Bacteroidales bacterium]
MCGTRVSKTGKGVGECTEDFKQTVSNGYYIDKSLFIKDIFDDHNKVTLITRPRRFGKSLNMDMVKTFFEKTDEDTSVYFRDLEIWKCGEKYLSEQGRHPVIHLDFKEVSGRNWEEIYDGIKSVVAEEYKRHQELNQHVDEDWRVIFKNIKAEKGSLSDYKKSIKVLSELLHKYHHVKPIILIDEYDAPVMSAIEHECYSDVMEFFKNFLSATLKGNEYLDFAFLTGVNQIAGAGLFSGFNNARIYTVLNDRYSKYFGFTGDEVRKLLDDFGAADKYDEVCEWYDGYIFGHEEIFNPISILNYVDEGFKPHAYWISTSGRIVFKTMIRKITNEVLNNLIDLSLGKSISVSIKTNLTYDDFNDVDNVYSVLFMTGYLKLYVPKGTNYERELDEAIETAKDGKKNAFKLVNKEIADSYVEDILEYAKGMFRFDFAANLQNAVNKGDKNLIEKEIKEYIYESISFYNNQESLYHGIVLGLLKIMRTVYAITSDRESGEGRYDITVEPLRGIDSLPGIVLELKVCDKEDDLPAKAEEALNQINGNDYARDMVTRGVKDVLKIGMAFYGKKVVFAS